MPYWLTLALLLVGSTAGGATLIYDTDGSFIDRSTSGVRNALLASFDGVLSVSHGLRAAETAFLGKIVGEKPPQQAGAVSSTADAPAAAAPIEVKPVVATLVAPSLEPRVAAPIAPTPASTIAAPPAVANPSAPVPIDPDLAASLKQRANELLRSRDIGAARLVFLRVAGSGDAEATTGVGRTFDPAFLKGLGAVGFSGDSGQAAYWYGRARDLGDEDAAALLRGLPPG